MAELALYDDLAPVTKVQAQLIAFMRLARQKGFRVGVAEEIEAQRITAMAGVMNRRRVRNGLRALMCSSRHEWNAFEEFFDQFWMVNNLKSEIEPAQNAPVSDSAKQKGGPDGARTVAVEAEAIGLGDNPSNDNSGTREGASGTEPDMKADFGFMMDEAEMKAAQDAAEEIARKMSMRVVRRQKACNRRNRLDLRRTMRSSLRYGGEPMELCFRDNYQRPWKLVVLLDVSKSMSMYSGVFLRFARGLVNAFSGTNAYAYHTRLVPLTEALKTGDLMEMRDRLKLLSSGWSGGTRIGESLQSFLNIYSPVLTRRTIVVILSDGLDTGEPDLLGKVLERMKGQCSKLIWLNPLLGREGYEPEARGMKAAIPFIDLFAPAHNLKSLQALEPEFARL